MKKTTNDYDSKVYRKLFELAQKEGPEAIIDFIVEYEDLKGSDLLTKSIINGRHDTLSFSKKHKAMIDFIRSLQLEKAPHFMRDLNFPRFAKTITEEKIPTYIEGAKALEDLQVKNIRILDKVNGIICYPTIIYYDEDNITSISKQYTNGVTIYQHISEGTNLKTEMYRNSITFSHNTPRIALSTEIKKDEQIHTEADLSDFGFDIDTLPTYEELTSLTPPESLQKSKVYVKR